MLPRPRDESLVHIALQQSRVVLIVGPRQVGKTTLARSIVDLRSLNYFDLERPDDLARLDSPMSALENLRGIVVIDEVQHRPDLFQILRVLADRPDRPATFLILGSAAPDALRQASESLTGRIREIHLGGFGGADPDIDPDLVWLRGGFPEALLASSSEQSMQWRQDYVRNLATRDLPAFGMRLPAATIERYLNHLVHMHGSQWNAAAVARALGISELTSRRYLDALTDALIIRVLRPWYENLGKRLTRSPKIYFRDTGIVHERLGIGDMASLMRSNAHGATWESFVIDECLRRAPGYDEYYWRTSNGAELDLLLVKNAKRVGIEIKRTDAPRVTSSMRSAMEDLALDALWVVYPGDKRYTMGEKMTALPISELLSVTTIETIYERTRRQIPGEVLEARTLALKAAQSAIERLNIPALTRFSHLETTHHQVNQIRANRGISTLDTNTRPITIAADDKETRHQAIRAIVQLFFGLGYLDNQRINKVSGRDLISPYMNHTTLSTARALDNAIGETLFVDDIYEIFEDTSEMPDLPMQIPQLTASGDIDMAQRLPRIDGSRAEECVAVIRGVAKKERPQLLIIVGGDKHSIDKFLGSGPYGMYAYFVEHLDLDIDT